MSRKNFVLSFLWSFLFLIFVTTFFCSAEASATTITVGGPDSGADYECDLSNAHNGISQALQKAKSLGGATVVLKGATTYTIKETMHIYSNTTLTGESGAKLKLGNGLGWKSMQPIIRSDNCNGITIHGFEIDGNYSGNGQYKWGKGYFNMVGVWNCTNIEIYDMFLHDSHGDGLRAYFGGNVKFHNNKIERLGHDALYCLQMKNIEYYSNKVVTRTNSGCRVSDCSGVRIYDNYITAISNSGGPGIQIDSWGKAKSEDIQVYNNTLERTYGPGIWMTRLGGPAGDKSYAYGAKIYNNKFIETGTNPSTDWPGAIFANGWEKTVIQNNTFEGNYGYGIAVADAKYPRKMTSVGSGYTTYIIDNTFKNTKNHKITGSGIAIFNQYSANKLILKDNKFENNPTNIKGNNIINTTVDIIEELKNIGREIGSQLDYSDLKISDGSDYSSGRVHRTKPDPPKERPKEVAWNPKSEKLKQWQLEVKELLKQDNKPKFTKPNIRKIPDFIDNILYMQEPGKYKLDRIPDVNLYKEYDSTSKSSGTISRSTYDALLKAFTYTGEQTEKAKSESANKQENKKDKDDYELKIIRNEDNEQKDIHPEYKFNGDVIP